jgi:DNA polymerase/3'-5' exonuclease PolX
MSIEPFIEDLRELSNLYLNRRDDYKSLAFSRAAGVFTQLINNPPVSGEEASKHKGIGKSSGEAYDEWLLTGKISRLEELRKSSSRSDSSLPSSLPNSPTIELNTEINTEINTENNIQSPTFSPNPNLNLNINPIDIENQKKKQIIAELMTVHGIGRVSAEKFYNLGCRTIDDLSKYPLTPAQILGYLYYDHLNLKIQREEIDQFKSILEKVWQFLNLKWLICGSYRRELPESGDVDILIEEKAGLTLEYIVDILVKNNLIVGNLALGNTKYMGIYRLLPHDQYNAHRIDIRLVPHNSWHYSTLYFTGSQALNILMRQKAISMNMNLSEYGLSSGMININVNSEQEIFNILGFEYVEPKDRSLM